MRVQNKDLWHLWPAKMPDANLGWLWTERYRGYDWPVARPSEITRACWWQTLWTRTVKFLYICIIRFIRTFYDKSSAVAEMGDREHNRHGPKRGRAAVHLSRGGAGTPSNIMWPGLRSTSVPSGVFIHNRHETKTGGCAPFRGSCNPYLTQHCLGPGLPSYQVAPWSIQPFGHNQGG